MTTVSQVFAITEPAELAASTPSLIGFAPADSVVALFVASGRLVVTMRCDLDQDWSDIAEGVVSTGAKVGAEEAFILLYAAREGGLGLRSQLLDLSELLSDRGVTVRDALLVDGCRWWSFMCRDCCQDEGHLVDPGLDRIGDGTVSAQRSDIAARYERRVEEVPGESDLSQAQKALEVPLRERAECAWTALEALASGPADHASNPATLVAVVQLAVQDVRCRDYVLGMVAKSEDPAALVEAFVDAAVRSHDETLPRMAGAAAALLAATESSTVPASCLVDLAGSDSLAQLVDAGLRTAVSPGAFSAILADSLPLTVAMLDEEARQ